MRILVLGSGAREHSIVTSLLGERPSRADDAPHEVTVAPGNAGIAAIASTADVDPADPAAVTALARRLDPALVVIGPEAPLVAGVADALREAGIPVFGPGREAAELEGSKAFAKEVMEAAAVPTGAAFRVTSRQELEQALDRLGAPYVVKADGLAAGKGVLVTESREAAVAHAQTWLPYGPVLVEEHLSGPEISLFFVTDGQTALPLAPAQDFKRLEDADEGPNTGGMGAYSPLPWLDAAYGSETAFTAHILEVVAQPVIDELARRDRPFVGLLYCGLVITASGVKVIEFNARFGDPETQVVLARLTTPLSELLYSAAIGALATRAAPEFSTDSAVTVVLASEGYPDAPVLRRRIEGLDAALAVDGVTISHAATASANGGALVSSGGRVLSVIATADTSDAARDRVYAALDRIVIEGGHYRTDIAAAASTFRLPARELPR